MGNYVETINLDDEELLLVRNQRELPDIARYAPFGQILAEEADFSGSSYTYSAQGFDITTSTSPIYAIQTFVSTDGDNSGKLVAYSLTSNAIAYEYTLTGSNFGHLNSIAYYNGYVYIAANGGDTSSVPYITALNLSDGSYATTSVTMYPWAIACRDGKFYVLGNNTSGSAVLRVYTTSYFSSYTEYSMTYDTSSTYQGLSCDGEYLFLPKYRAANTNNINNGGSFIEVRNLEGTFIKNIYLPIPYEPEEIGIYGTTGSDRRRAFISESTYGEARILEIDLGYNYQPLTMTTYANNMTKINQTYVSRYVNEDYTGFYSTGTSSYPLNNLAFAYYDIPDAISRLNIYLASDISNSSLSLYCNKLPLIYIYGQGNTINGDLLFSANYIYLYNFTITGYISVLSGTFLYAYTVNFGNSKNTSISTGFLQAYCNTYLNSCGFYYDSTTTGSNITGIAVYGNLEITSCTNIPDSISNIVYWVTGYMSTNSSAISLLLNMCENNISAYNLPLTVSYFYGTLDFNKLRGNFDLLIGYGTTYENTPSSLSYLTSYIPYKIDVRTYSLSSTSIRRGITVYYTNNTTEHIWNTFTP